MFICFFAKSTGEKMPKPVAMIKYDKCNPEKCNLDGGICDAELVCTRNILKQEEPFESPMLYPADMCQGCGDCVAACPFDAIKLTNT